MKQIIESLLKATVNFSNVLNSSRQYNSHNKIENHFHGPVTFIQRKKLRSNTDKLKSI